MKNKLYIKNSYNELTIKENREINTILQSPTLNENQKMLGIVNILVSDREMLKRFTVKEMQQALSQLTFLNEDMVANGIKKEYKIGDRKYYCQIHPNKLTTAQYTDMVNIIEGNKDMYAIIEKLVGIFLIPKGHTYNEGYDIEENIQYLLNNCPITVANDIGFFLFTLNAFSAICSLQSLVNQVKTMKKTATTIAEKKKIQEMEMEIQKLNDGFGLDL